MDEKTEIILDRIFSDAIVFVNEKISEPVAVTVWEGEWEVKFLVREEKLKFLTKINHFGKRSLFIPKNEYSKISRKAYQAVKIAIIKSKRRKSEVGAVINITA
jgi:hypothetical protein